MAEIAASAVMKLRKISGQGMMDCKKALEEAGGDLDAALDLLRKKGLATLSKRAERQTSEGLVVARVAEDAKRAVMATLCCETDFVAKSDEFAAAARRLLDYAEACPADQGAENLAETELDGKKFSQIITETVSKTGEKIQIGDYRRFAVEGPGLISQYVHFNKKVGTLVQVRTSDDATAAADPVKQVASEIAMHITATKPIAIDRNGIDAETIEREKAIFAEQVKNKPPQIIEKIVEGKINKFFAENCLLEQRFVKDDSKSVRQVLAEVARQAGGEAEIVEFVRFEVG